MVEGRATTIEHGKCNCELYILSQTCSLGLMYAVYPIIESASFECNPTVKRVQVLT